ncbi:MAG TPA: archaeosortase/exosortase family protein, partial [Chloroflexota bacterium]
MAVAFWFSLYSAVDGGLDSPLGIAPAAVPLAGWAGYLALRRKGGEQPGRDFALDGTIGLTLIAAALWTVLGEPERLGWRYWAERQDLIGFELFALGAACWLFGVGTIWRAKIGLLVLAIGSPPALNWLQERLAPPMAAFTAWAAHLAIGPLQLHFQSGTAANIFRGVSDAGVTYHIQIADACSGLASWVSILLTGIPAALYLGLGVAGTLGWLAAGLALASVANVFRIVVLLFTAQHMSPSFALGTIHPMLGAVLLFGVLLALLMCVEGEPLPPRLGWQLHPGKASLTGLMLVSLVGAGSEARLLPFADL